MILYFADRELNIIGQASTELPQGLTVVEDLKTEDIETGVAVFECKIPFNKDTRSMVVECAEVGNYILRSHNGENEFYQIIESEIDTKNQEVYIYAEDDGMDLLNDVHGAYEADAAYPIAHYINKYAACAGFEIGINEVANLTRKLSWDGESTATERIASVANQFGGCEVSYSFEIDGLTVTKKYINIYKERGKDIGAQLRLNFDVDGIITTKTISNLATALQATGGTPDDENPDDDIDPVPITLKGYKFDDGDFYVDSDGILKSRKALARWRRLLWKTEDSKKAGGHIVKPYSYDTLSQEELCKRTITELKKICDMEVNYKVDIAKLPDDVGIGDRIAIVDDAGELYLSTRILYLETSVADQKHKATLGEHLIKSSGISQKVADLAAQFAKASVSASRALTVASNAKSIADAAQGVADSALLDAQGAQQAAQAAQNAANSALESASDAQEKANAAQSAVDTVEESVASLETTVNNAQTAADNAQVAAQTAQAKAEEAARSAEKALTDAAEAKTASETSQSTANSAVEKANTAQNTADTAKTNAATAQETAAAAKLDAEQAQKDIDGLGESLTTLESTMVADYARKTDLTEATANLQTQITRNANEISSTASRVQTIDETANDAQEKAQAAQTAASTAKAQADQATADAKAAQTAADNAATAAANAQSEADTAKAAAVAAQGVADKAEADLEAAKADLATVTSRVGATEEEIAAAQQAVTAAQTAADKAKADAQSAATKAAEAQETANTAVTNAGNAQAAADDAASKAALAQKTADEAKGDAAAAQAKADEAAQAAQTAQATADAAKTDATNAQTAADQAAAKAATAQKSADDADARAAQAAADLATAQQNLADVTSRVGATEEEVAAAQAAVNTAQAAADKAKAEAEAAQATADAAKVDAATAQQAADEAQTAANNAQTAADEAQKAADDAQAAVDALAVRVTTAETKITQNSEAIELRALKTEVTKTLGGYYTKEQADAAIKVSADAIKSTVSNTYATKQEVNDIEIGGRNLIVQSTLQNGYRMGATGEAYVSKYSSLTQKITVSPGEQLTYTVHVVHTDEGDTYWQVAFFTADDIFISSPVMAIATTTKEKTSWTVDIPANASYARAAFPTTVRDKVKLEYGNKATDWTPSTEDVSDDINAAQTTADDALESVTSAESAIQQLADSIASLVRSGESGSLIHQDANGLYYFDISGLESSLSDTANGLDDLEGIVLDANGEIDVLKSTAEALQKRTEYIHSYTDENGNPCIELGEGDSEFKVYITNTGIKLSEGTTSPATITRRMLVIEKAMVRNELQFGDDEDTTISGVWIWKRRSNGNLGLMWKEGGN